MNREGSGSTPHRSLSSCSLPLRHVSSVFSLGSTMAGGVLECHLEEVWAVVDNAGPDRVFEGCNDYG